MTSKAVAGRRRRRRGLALGAALIAVAAGTTPAQAASVTGRVANDYNANGVRDTVGGLSAAVDSGLSGVTVRAYGADGALVASALSAADGTYTLSFPDGARKLRVEFTGLPTGYDPAPVRVDGTGNGTTVQFVSIPAGSKPTVANVDLGASVPGDYCADNPLIISCEFTFGGTDANVDSPAVLGFRPSVAATQDDIRTNPGDEVVLAKKSQVGSVYGEAVAPNGDVYVSAYTKAHTGYGRLGIGGVYRIPAQGAGYAPPTAYATVPGVGTNPHDTSDYVADDYATTYKAIGKRGLGDLETSPLGDALYSVNLTNNRLVRIPLTGGAGPATPTTGAVVPTPPGCTAGDWHAFGFGTHLGLLYVGGVCAGETAGDAVKASVWTYDPTAGTDASGFSAAPVLTTGDLTAFSRKCADRAKNTSPTDGTNAKANCPTPNPAQPLTSGAPARVADWHPWTEDATLPRSLKASEGTSPTLDVVAHPQPMLSSIGFQGDDMIVGFRDRWGDQLGNRAYGPQTPDIDPNTGKTALYIGVGAGDLYRACRASPAGVYTLESNAKCGAVSTPGANDQEGPGGGEFFYGDDAAPHDQTFLGAAVKLGGYRDVVSNAFDPIFDGINEGGVVWSNSSDGGRSDSVRVYDDLYYAANGGTSFGKANGLGDLEAVCTAAPLQIGNRVFADTDRDGIQDAGEPGISGVSVQLYDGDTLVGTTTTDANGQYLFGGPGSNVTLQPGTSYTVRIPTAQAPITGMQASPTAAGPTRTVDSNGAVSGGVDVGSVTTGTAGENDHTIDFGFFTPRYDLALRKTVAADEVQPGDVVPFTITVFNQSPDSSAVTKNVALIDQLPPGLQLADPNWTPGPNNTATRTIAGPLAPGGSFDVTIRLKVLDVGGDLVNRAEITGFTDTNGHTQPDIDSTPDTNVLNDHEIDDVIDNSGGDEDDEDLAILHVRRYDLALRKTTPDDLVSPGQLVPFTVTVFNQSPDAGSDARDIQITDTIPAGLTFSAADNPGWTDVGGGQARYTVPGPLAVGASTNVAIQLRVDGAAPDGALVNRAEISAFQNSSGTGQPTDIDSTPDTNPLNDTEIDDVIDNSGGDEDDEDLAQVHLVRYDLALRKTVAATLVHVGDLVPFTVTVFNQATDPLAVAQNITITDTVPLGFSFDAADNPGWDTTGDGREIATTIAGPVAPGDSTAVTVNLRVAPGATDDVLTNFAEISSFTNDHGDTVPDVDSTPDTNPDNDTIVDDVIDNSGGDEDDSDIATVTLAAASSTPPPPKTTPKAPKAVLKITKTFISKSAVAGETVSYLVKVTNTSGVTAKNVVVCDTLPSKLVFVSASVRTVLRAGKPCFKLGTLAARKSRSFTVRAKIVSDVAGSLTNNVTVTADNAAAKRAHATVAVKALPERGGGVTG